MFTYEASDLSSKLNLNYIYLLLNFLFEKSINQDNFSYDMYTKHHEPNNTKIQILRSAYAFKLFNKDSGNVFNLSF